MRGKVFGLGILVLIVGALGWYGNQDSSFLGTDYNCGNCNGAPQASTFAVPLDAAYAVMAVGLIILIAGAAMKSKKLEAA